MRIRLLLLFCLLGINSIVYAEGGCPPGTYLANPPATNICNPFPGNENNGQPQQPQGRWETRWGAIAIGSTATGGGVGFSKDMNSRRQAENAAVSQCMATGGGGSAKNMYYATTTNAQLLLGGIPPLLCKVPRQSKLLLK